MTINRSETMYGRPVGKPQEVEVGTTEPLYFGPLYRTIISIALRVDSPDKVTWGFTTSLGGGISLPVEYEKEAINKAKLESFPSPFLGLKGVKDFVLWRRRYYTWTEGN